MRPTATPSIRDYAVIGDARSAALVSLDGSIDWLCWPRFDSPSLFAAILDDERGGFWQIAPRGGARANRSYVEDSNVLVTIFEASGGRVRVTDLMAIWNVAAFHVTSLFSWWFGAAIGFVHGAFVLVVGMPALPGMHPRMASELRGPTVVQQLEPPGFLARNYGVRTPISVLIAHIVFGALLGFFYVQARDRRRLIFPHRGLLRRTLRRTATMWQGHHGRRSQRGSTQAWLPVRAPHVTLQPSAQSFGMACSSDAASSGAPRTSCEGQSSRATDCAASPSRSSPGGRFASE